MISAPSLSKKKILSGTQVFLCGLVAFVAFFSPHLAFAQTVTPASLGDVICNAANQMSPFIDFFCWMAYTAGAFIGASAIYMLARNMEAPGQAPLPQAFARLLGSALLLALPSLGGAIVESIYGSGGDLTSKVTCNANPIAATSTTNPQTLDMMLVSFVGNIQGPILALLTTASLVFGVFLMFRGAMKASKYGTDPRTASVTSIISSMVFGAVFIVVGQNLDIMMASVFGAGATIMPQNVLQWKSITSLGLAADSNFVKAIQAALTFFQLIGFIAFLRGWNVIKNAVEGNGQATVAQGLTHVIGGVLCINIYQFLQIMNTTFGTNFIS